MNVKELKESISIVSVVENYTDLEQQGQEYRGLCCLHDDNHSPSLYVNPERSVWKCFGCNRGGDVITFIEEVEGLDFKEAVEFLADGEEIEFNGTYNKDNNTLNLLDICQTKDNHQLSECLLQKYQHGEQHGYLLNKGFTEDILNFFEVGYCDDPGDELYNRITIPWRNMKGELVAIAGRDITDEKDSKYKAKKNSRKIDYLYNLNNAKHFCDDGLTLVEDEKSVMRLWQFGYKNGVALGNKELGDRKWLLRQFTDTVILCMDNDKAGKEARNKIIQQLIPLANIEVINLPDEYKDVAEIKEKKMFDECWGNRDKLNI